MLRYLASGFLARSASRRLARVIPNPFVRTLAMAATGYAITRAMTPTAKKAIHSPRTRGVLGRFRPA